MGLGLPVGAQRLPMVINRDYHKNTWIFDVQAALKIWMRSTPPTACDYLENEQVLEVPFRCLQPFASTAMRISSNPTTLVGRFRRNVPMSAGIFPPQPRRWPPRPRWALPPSRPPRRDLEALGLRSVYDAAGGAQNLEACTILAINGDDGHARCAARRTTCSRCCRDRLWDFQKRRGNRLRRTERPQTHYANLAGERWNRSGTRPAELLGTFARRNDHGWCMWSLSH